MQKGFLKESDALPKPVSVDALEKLFHDTLETSDRLRKTPNDDDSPYETRYEEREFLHKLSKQAAANQKAEKAGTLAHSAAVAFGAHAEYLLGVNYMETEEPGQAQTRLEAAIHGLGCSPQEVVAQIDAVNHLGILWSNRGESRKAFDQLTRADELYRATADRLTAEPGLQIRDAEKLEDMHTLTTFYLAQAHGALGNRTESAAYCHYTLQRQLQRRGKVGGGEHQFDEHEWARNAAQVWGSMHYLGWRHRCSVVEQLT